MLPDLDAQAGEPLTVRPIDNCTMEGEGPGILSWRWQIGIDFPVNIRGETDDAGEVPLNEDGSWEVSFTASTFSDRDVLGDSPGSVPFFFEAFCLPNGRAGHDAEVDFCFFSEQVDDVAVTAEEPPFDCMLEVYFVEFNVTLSPSTTPPTAPPGTGTPPPPAPPATPVVEQPSVTG
jgi:hypothetical protein